MNCIIFVSTSCQSRSITDGVNFKLAVPFHSFMVIGKYLRANIKYGYGVSFST